MILIDSGPLVALLDADDQHHPTCKQAVKELREPLGTVWPAVTEAMYLWDGLLPAQEALWEMLERKAVRLVPLDHGDFRRMRDLMRKYADRPMDLADAALVRAAEREGIRKIFTVDATDFSVYRIHGRIRFTILP